MSWINMPFRDCAMGTVVVLISLLHASPCAAADVRTIIAEYVSNGPDPALGVLTAGEGTELNELYAAGGYLPLWIENNPGQLSRDALDALTLLGGAAAEGLEPADYRSGHLDRLRTTLPIGVRPSAADVAGSDVALSAATLRYFHHMHRGRVDPRTVGLRLTVPTDRHDFATLLRSALADHRLKETAESLRPQLAQFAALRTMLARYRSIAAATPPQRDDRPRLTAPIHPGERYSGADALCRQLVALGDLPLADPQCGGWTAYAGALVDGVERFQVRHGLAADGVLGKGTDAALRMPLTHRVRQIELALERLRWLPHLGPGRLIALNIPMFRLWVWDNLTSSRDPSFGLNVIVGRALRTQTPVFVEQLEEVVFRPYWNVPPSIALHEILPLLQRDPEYLRRQHMDIVRGPGDDALLVDATADNIALLRQGTLRFRQRPGPQNALGLVKFVFPNDENVYMHGTPAQALFSQTRRDFSHGCVRVEDPVALAEWVLSDQPEWTRDRIISAMNGTESIHVRLLQPIQVILFYTTAAVMPEDGTIRFSEDIYRHDAKLDEALARRRSPLN